MTLLYAHAAPVIRELLIRAVHQGRTSKLKREQSANMAHAYGFARALDVMSMAHDQTPVAGIAGDFALPSGSIDMTREYLGNDADRILGTTPQPTTPREDLAPPQVPWIPAKN